MKYIRFYVIYLIEGSDWDAINWDCAVLVAGSIYFYYLDSVNWDLYFNSSEYTETVHLNKIFFKAKLDKNTLILKVLYMAIHADDRSKMSLSLHEPCKRNLCVTLGHRLRVISQDFL